MEKVNDIKIYKRYLEVKCAGGRIGDIMGEFGISRSTLYDVIRRVQNGDNAALRRCMTQSRLDCLWNHKYKTRFLALPKDRTMDTVNELRGIIFGMKEDGFPIQHIANLLGKERSTIAHHIATLKYLLNLKAKK